MTGIGHMGLVGNLQARVTKALGSVLLGGSGRTRVSGALGTILITDPSWRQTPPNITHTPSSPSHDYSQYIDNWDPDNWDIIRNTSGNTLPADTVIDADGVTTFTDNGVYETKSGIILEIVPSAMGDWAARTNPADGVFFTENFNYTTLTQAANHAANPCFYGISAGSNSSSQSTPDPSIYAISDVNALSGRSLRINFPANSGGAGYRWIYSFDPNTGIQATNNLPFSLTRYDNFYFQAIIWGDRQFNFPFKQTDGQMGNPKVLIIDEHNGGGSYSGEFVLTNERCAGYTTCYLGFTASHGSSLLSRSMNTPQATPDFLHQGAVDTQTPTSPQTMQQFRQRYGPFWSDSPSVPTGSVTGSSTMEQYGFPNADSAASGLAWQRGYWTVIEMWVNSATNSAKFWGARYGDAPKILGNTATAGTWNFGRTAAPGYPGFILTPFITNNANAAGAAQPTTFTDYVELIASHNPIPFPKHLSTPLP
jgi:hypothetical protein